MKGSELRRVASNVKRRNNFFLFIKLEAENNFTLCSRVRSSELGASSRRRSRFSISKQKTEKNVFMVRQKNC